MTTPRGWRMDFLAAAALMALTLILGAACWWAAPTNHKYHLGDMDSIYQ